jgi:hypothetical protein
VGALTIELGEDLPPGRCLECGHQTGGSHGLLDEDGEPKAIYRATWCPGHKPGAATLLIGIGDEWETSERGDLAVLLEVRAAAEQFEMSVLEADRSPWPETGVFGPLLDREEALESERIQEVFEAAGRVVTEDPRVSAFLDEEAH